MFIKPPTGHHISSKITSMTGLRSQGSTVLSLLAEATRLSPYPTVLVELGVHVLLLVVIEPQHLFSQWRHSFHPAVSFIVNEVGMSNDKLNRKHLLVM